MDKTALEILEKVNSFYSASFSQLLTITLGLVAFIGVFVPVLTTYYQNRNIKIEKENLEEFINNKLESIKLEVTKEIRDELLNDLSEFEDKQKSQIEKVIAGVFYVQANAQLNKGFYKNAADSLFSAIVSSIKGKDELNLLRAFKLLIDRAIPNITQKEEPDFVALEERIESIEKELAPLNANGRYSDTIRDLIKAKNVLIKKLTDQE
ncbi:hypothetical protein [Pseudoalteromonas xiamenensis]